MVVLFRQGFLFDGAPEADVSTMSAVYRYGGQGRWCISVDLSVLTALRVEFSHLLIQEKSMTFHKLKVIL